MPTTINLDIPLSADERERIRRGEQEQEAMTRLLYETMPSAPRPRTQGGDFMWGDVEGNDHWQFCSTIARLIFQTAHRR